MRRPAMEIDRSLVLLTGASGGLGGAIARGLDARGARLLLTGRNLDVLHALASQLRHAEALACDLADREQLDDLLSKVGDVDILVANAALPAAGTLDTFTTAELDRAIDVNLRAPMLLARALAPRMIARARGQIVFISSMGGKVPAPRLSVYAATKYGLRGFAACLRQELHGTGVGVSVVSPGSVRDVGMWAEAGARSPVGTVESSAVAADVVRAIQTDRGDIDVAPRAVRAGSLIAHVAPELFARLARRSGIDRQTTELADGLRHKR